MKGRLILGGLVAALGLAGTANAQLSLLPPVPIISTSLLGPEQPAYLGAPAKPRRMKAPRPPQQPTMAPNGRSNLHNDGWMSDAYRRRGPLGRDPVVNSTLLAHECGSVTFDSRGRIVTVCVGLERPILALMDPVTLRVLADYGLPLRQLSTQNVNPFTDFSGGGYFYLDDRGRAVVPTTTGRLMIFEISDQPAFRLVRDVDLGRALQSGDKVISALPDASGRIWFASRQGMVGFVGGEGEMRWRDLGEEISNSFAVDGNSIYLVSDGAMYRLRAASGGVQTVWRARYRNDGRTKSGQTSPGSGTTPTVMGRWVAITDNSDPVNVVVYRRAGRIQGKRRVCRQPVFERGASSTDQSLIGFGRTIIAENNHGYSGPVSVEGGATTTGGLERVDVRKRGRGCKTVWRSDEIAPSVVPKASLGAGLVYTYTKPENGEGADPWYFTALDLRNGRTVYKVLAGEGLGFNNNYAPVTIGPDGAAYVGVLGGLVRIADSP